jgi:hypothetical protein
VLLHVVLPIMVQCGRNIQVQSKKKPLKKFPCCPLENIQHGHYIILLETMQVEFHCSIKNSFFVGSQLESNEENNIIMLPIILLFQETCNKNAVYPMYHMVGIFKFHTSGNH